MEVQKVIVYKYWLQLLSFQVSMPTSATSVGRNGSLDIYASSVDSHETQFYP